MRMKAGWIGTLSLVLLLGMFFQRSPLPSRE